MALKKQKELTQQYKELEIKFNEVNLENRVLRNRSERLEKEMELSRGL